MAYLVVRALDAGRKTPGDLSEQLKVPFSTISMTLRHLRQVDLVRYETHGKFKRYWIKEPSLLGILDSLEEWIERMRRKQE